MERVHTVRRNREVGAKFREANEAFLEYRKAYQRWLASSRRTGKARSIDLEVNREACARKASKACYEAGRSLAVLVWCWTFGE